MPDTKLIPGLPTVNADVSIGSGDGFFPKVEEISTADQTTVIGDGTTQRPLHGAGGGGGVSLLQNEVPIANNPHAVINVQDPLTVFDAGGEAQLTLDAAKFGLQAFEHAVDHTTDPNGFNVNLPVAMADALWIPEVIAQFPTVDDATQIFVLSRSMTALRLGALASFADGTILFITIKSKTN